MSGICGFVLHDGQSASPAALQAMLRVLARRGPDRQLGWNGGAAALGHALLATTPEARRALQPWRHPGSGCVVVADSRFDEREALCRELGVPADDPGGDAALAHAAFERWGEDCAGRLLGDFAFAIWDPRRSRLYCARDVFGVRPLHVFASAGMFAFATEAEALLALPGVDASLDESRIADSFVGILESMDETSAPYRSIERFPPATWMRMEAGRVHRQRYWSPVERGPAGLPASEAGWIEGLRAHLLEAVRCRMRADVPVGSMLSGGLDSSVVVAIASREAQAGGQGPFPTFSAVSAEPGCAETAAIALACATLPIAPTRFDARDERGELQRIVREWPQMGQPFDHCMAMQDALYAAAARRGVRVLMDGIDADSLFDEAGLLDDLLRSGRWRQLRRELRGYRDFYGGDARAWHLLRPILSGRIVPEWLRAGLRPMRARRQVAAQVADTLIAPDFARRVGFEERYARRSRNPVRSSAWADGLHGQSAVGLGTTTAAVERYNRVASRHAVEPRHPFLDRRLVEYCAWMPLELRQRDGWPKWALREAMAGRLHRDLAWRRGKEHLGPYVNQALFSQIASGDASLETLSAEVRPFVDAAKIAKLPPLGRPEAYGEWGWEPRLFVAALQAWLRPRRGGAGKPA